MWLSGYSDGLATMRVQVRFLVKYTDSIEAEMYELKNKNNKIERS